MVRGKFRPMWPELIAAVVGVALVFLAPIRIGWVGTVIIVLSVVSAITTLVLSQKSMKTQVVGMAVGAVAIAVGLLIGLQGDDHTEIFSPALVWVVGAGLVMSTLCTLLARKMRGSRKQVA